MAFVPPVHVSEKLCGVMAEHVKEGLVGGKANINGKEDVPVGKLLNAVITIESPSNKFSPVNITIRETRESFVVGVIGEPFLENV